MEGADLRLLGYFESENQDTVSTLISPIEGWILLNEHWCFSRFEYNRDTNRFRKVFLKYIKNQMR